MADSVDNYDRGATLTPCLDCGGHRYWWNGDDWQCAECAPPYSAGVIEMFLHVPTVGPSGATNFEVH